jgi:hypothetical protein
MVGIENRQRVPAVRLSSPTEGPDPEATDVPIDSSNDPSRQIAVSLFLRNAGARVRCDQPLQQSAGDALPVILCRLATVQFDQAQMFSAFVGILLGAEQAKGCAVVASERGSTELISQ